MEVVRVHQEAKAGQVEVELSDLSPFSNQNIYFPTKANEGRQIFLSLKTIGSCKRTVLKMFEAKSKSVWHKETIKMAAKFNKQGRDLPKKYVNSRF